MTDAVVSGQAYPAATVLTDLFVAAGNVTIGTLDICNHHGTNQDFVRVSISRSGVADTAAQYVVGGLLASGLPVDPTDTVSQTKGWVLRQGDKIRVRSLNGTTSFSISGVQW